MKYSIMLSLLLTACTQAPATTTQDAQAARNVDRIEWFIKNRKSYKTERVELLAKIAKLTKERDQYALSSKLLSEALKDDDKKLFEETEALSEKAGDVVVLHARDEQIDVYEYCEERAIKVTGSHAYYNESAKQVFVDRGEFAIGLPVGEYPSNLINACAVILHSDEF